MKATTRSLVSLLALTGAAGLLGAYAYWGVLQPEQKQASQKQKADQLVDLGGGSGSQEITSLKVTAKGDQTDLERGTDGSWRITHPLQAKADASVVEELVRQLESGRIKSILEERPSVEDLKRYGLESPRFAVEATTRGGRTVRVAGGLENSFDGSVYVQRSGDPAVYTLEGSARWAFDHNTFNLRDKQVAAFDPAQVTRISVTSKAGRYELSRTPQDRWLLTARSQSADKKTVEGMLNGLKEARAQAFLTPQPADRQKSGTQSPILELALALRSGKTLHARFGQGKSGGVTRTYLLWEDGQGSTLAEVSDSVLKSFQKTPTDLRDKSLLAFNEDAVESIDFIPGGARPVVRVAREHTDGGAGEWSLVAPQKGSARAWKITSVLWNLENLEAQKLEPGKVKDPAQYGLSAGARAVVLQDRQGKELGRLVLGVAVPGQKSWIYAMGPDRKVVQVDGSRFGDLPVQAADLLDTPVASAAPKP